jgi:hypothetical protein
LVKRYQRHLHAYGSALRVHAELQTVCYFQVAEQSQKLHWALAAAAILLVPPDFMLLLLIPLLLLLQVLAGVGLPANPTAFYRQLHSYLASLGVDGVKVDVQVCRRV